MEAKKKKKAVSLRTVNFLMIGISIIVVAVLLFLVLRVEARYRDLRASTEVFLTCETAAPDLNRGSDYLTEQVRLFAVTGEKRYCDQYFEEAKVTRRRDKAITALEPYLENAEALGYLNTAMQNSLELMDIEYYAMALVWSDGDYDRTQMPEEIKAVQLSEEDLALTPEEKQAKAVRLVFDETYQSYKQRITENVDLCSERLLKNMEAQQEVSYNKLSTIMILLFAMIVVMLIVVLAVIFVTLRLVMQPMMKAADYIREQQALPIKGASEVQFLAEAYNDVFEKTQQKHEDLHRTAYHDALTGLYNRAAYEEMYDKIDEENFCLMLIDVDKFKSVNDTYGHDVGDIVLKKAAEVLSNQFRSNDLIFRFGGDEFAVVMMNVTDNMKDLIKIKIGNANHQLSADSKIPAVSFSVGATFGNGNISEDLFKQADTALYEVKSKGGCGVSFSN